MTVWFAQGGGEGGEGGGLEVRGETLDGLKGLGNVSMGPLWDQTLLELLKIILRIPDIDKELQQYFFESKRSLKWYKREL